MTLKKYISLVVLSALLFGCGNSETKSLQESLQENFNDDETTFDKTESQLGTDIEYSIVNKDILLPHKASYDVRIFEKLSESQLQKISRELHRQSQNATKVFVIFYLPGMKVDAGAWATAHKGEDVRIMEFMLNDNPTTLNN